MISASFDLQFDSGSLEELCRRNHVKELCLFGSAARGEAGAHSDIDLLVEFFPNSNVGLIDYSGLMLELSKLLGGKVDLVSRNGLKPTIRQEVLNEARRLYAA